MPHQILAYAYGFNLIGDAIREIGRNANVLINACKNIGLTVNVRKNEYIEVECHRNMAADGYIIVR